MKNIYYEAGLRIRQIREEKCYSREYLAELADISPKHLYQIEHGQKGFSAHVLYKISEALEINSDFILFGEYRGKIDNEAQRVLSLFEGTQKEKIVSIIELIYSFTENN